MSVKLNSGMALVSVHSRVFSLHLLVKPEPYEVYKRTKDGGEKVVEYERWLWGRGTELYDHSIEYFGLGPFLLLCW